MKKVLSCILIFVMLFGLSTGVFSLNFENQVEKYEVNTEFDTMGDFTVSGAAAKIVAIDDNGGNALHVNPTSNTTVQYTKNIKYTYDYYSEFRLKVVKNPNWIIINLCPGTIRSQINIKSNGTQIQMPVQPPSGSKIDKTVTISQIIADYTPFEWHTWKVTGVNGIQSIYIDGVLVFSDYTQNPWSSNFTTSFYGQTGNEFYVDNFKFGQYSPDTSEFDNKSIYESAFNDSADWTIDQPEGTIGSIQNAFGENALAINTTGTGLTKTVSALYKQVGNKYNLNTSWEFRINVQQITATTIMKACYGYTRTYMEMINGGNSIRLKDAAGANQEINITTKISNYNPKEWHVFRVDKIGSMQTVYIDDIFIMQCSLQPFASDFELNFWANGSGTGNEFYIDYVKLNKYKDLIPLTYGKGIEFYNQNDDLMDSTNITWTTNSTTITGADLSLGNDLIHIKKSDNNADTLYLNRAFTEASSRMTMQFDLQIPNYSRQNTIMIRNGQNRVQVQFYANYIECRNSDNQMSRVETNVGTGWHNWKFVIWDGMAMIYKDNNLIFKYFPHATTDSRLLQFVCQNDSGTTVAEMNVKNLIAKNLTGSFIIDEPVLSTFDANTDSNVSANVYLANYSSYDGEVTPILTTLEDNYKLREISAETVTLAKSTYQTKVLTLPVNNSIIGAKAYVFNNLRDLKPFTNCITTFNFTISPLKVPSIFSSNSVMQREKPLTIWGTATTGKTVTVKLDQKTYTAQADENGKWQVIADPITVENNPYQLEVTTDSEAIISNNILAGDVWLCSGQSNMEWKLVDTNSVNEIPLANYPNIRLFSQSRNGSTVQLDDVKNGRWDICSPETVSEFSGVGYLFGKELHNDLSVPIGLINASYGGSMGEAWVSEDALKNSELSYRRFYILTNDTLRYPTRLFNAMISPIIPYGMKGVIWYQGEANAGEASYSEYKRLQEILVADWRNRWGEQFPFIYAQLSAHTEGTRFEYVREAQAQFAKESVNTAMVVTIDVGDPTTIHPKDKATVAHRMALAAKGMVYNLNVSYKSPSAVSKEVYGNELAVTFDNVGLGLTSTGDVQGFEICGEDDVYYPAVANITSENSVVLTSDNVVAPVGVRYAFKPYPNPIANLYSSDGLPAIPFRMDN